MTMKSLMALFIFAYALLISCGPSQEELKRREQAIADSIHQVFKLKQLEEDEKRRIAEAEEEKRRIVESEREEKRMQEEYNSRPEVIREKLLQIEKSNSLDYLSVEYTLDFRVLSGNTVIKGRIYNDATIATFKDVEIIISCYTKTNTFIQAFSHVIYDYFRPKKFTSFTVQLRPPNNTEIIGVEIRNAENN
jgi:hypothetical protein